MNMSETWQQPLNIPIEERRISLMCFKDVRDISPLLDAVAESSTSSTSSSASVSIVDLRYVSFFLDALILLREKKLFLLSIK